MKTLDLLEGQPSAARVRKIAEIAVPLPIPGTFSYEIPAELESAVIPGVRVRAPFKNREITGYVVSRNTADTGQKLKPVTQVLDTTPVFSDAISSLSRWIAEYYGCSWGEAIENALPKWVKYGQKAVKAWEAYEAKTEKEPEFKKPQQAELALTDEQQAAFREITASLDSKAPVPILLHGVTGSGKSELYIRSIKEVLKRGKAAICLVPEIALTEQLKLFFALHFGPELEILHSKLTDKERFLAWKRIEQGRKRVMLGPRSAVFAPCAGLGLIIMDEEHEGTYKQETAPRYHAREVAFQRARSEGALFVMGTATPSLECMDACEKGIFKKISMKFRVDKRSMPEVTIVDLKHAPFPGKRSLFTIKLTQEIQLNLQKKQGTLLLLNRRGFSTHIHCMKCGNVEQCPSCQVSLTFHQEKQILLCHYCNYQKSVDSECSSCKAQLLKFTGFGTEKVESEIAAKFPGARIARMDADSVKHRGSHEEILSSFRRQEIDILIGTQMIAKGFDFPHVTLVGVILADVGLSLPDFRSAERTFQLMTQVAGRAGRGQEPGRVVIQTYSPDHPSIRFAKNHDYESFYKHEKAERETYGYPPSTRLINVIIRSKKENDAYLFARTFRDALAAKLGPALKPRELELIGPAPLPFYKLRGHFRWHVMLKTRDTLAHSPVVQQCLASLKKPAGTAFALDVDPLNIL